MQVEVDVSFGLPGFTMVGLPDASVRESRDRVRSAIRNSGFEFPPHRITVNLAPADIRKAGSSFDLPIALGVLAATRLRHAARRRRRAAASASCRSTAGIQPARGVLPIAAAARREHVRGAAAAAAESRGGGGGRGLTAVRRPLAGRSGRRAERSGCASPPSRGDRRAPAPVRGRRAMGISPTSTGRRWRGARSRSPRPAVTTR